jgi:hypothetical protein
MSDTPVSVFVTFVGVGAAGVLGRLYLGRSARSRITARRLYTNKRAIIWLRNAIPLVPIWAPASFVMGTLVLFPRWVGEILISPTLALGLIAFIAAYKVPAPFLPTWLRTEIDEGSTPVARPGGWDWVILAFVVPIFVASIVGIPLYFFMYGSGPR